MCRTEKGGQAGSEIETAAICLAAAHAHEDSPEADAGWQLEAFMRLDLHALTLRREG